MIKPGEPIRPVIMKPVLEKPVPEKPIKTEVIDRSAFAIDKQFKKQTREEQEVANLPDKVQSSQKQKPTSQQDLINDIKKRELDRLNQKLVLNVIGQRELDDEEMRKEIEEDSPLIEPNWKIGDA